MTDKTSDDDEMLTDDELAELLVKLKEEQSRDDEEIINEDVSIYAQMYGGEKQKRAPNPDVIAKVKGANMTTTRTKRHITIALGGDQVTLPSPQMVYDLELAMKRLEKQNGTLMARTARLENQIIQLRKENARLERELGNKVDLR